MVDEAGPTSAPQVGVSMKYARVEAERRFLLEGLPDLPVARTTAITDRYVTGTRLRLRLVDEEGCPPAYKLGQKLAMAGAGPSTNAHTTMYLTAEEHRLLSALPAAVLKKTRHHLAVDGHWVVDVHVSGLVLAETEGGGDPPFAHLGEVTDEERYTGGALSQVDGQGQVV